VAMFWKKREKLTFPTETLGYDEYYVTRSGDLLQLDGVNVKFEGILTEKPVVEFYAAGWPWSISSRLVEEDHGHRTLLKVNGVTVYFKGPLYLAKEERITVWGKLKEGVVQAKRIEGTDIIYQA
jgi:hypothetical protein